MSHLCFSVSLRLYPSILVLLPPPPPLHMSSLSPKRPFSLLVMKVPSLRSLGLRSLREISDGSVYISNNTNLCYHHTVNWTRLFTGGRRQRRQAYNDIKYNKALHQCVAEGHVCDPLCSDSGCWGLGPEQCLSCRNHSRLGVCVSHCNFFFGEPREYAGRDGECIACHSECLPQEGKLSCTGTGADKCVACSRLRDGPHCVSSCPNGVMGERGALIFKYPNKHGQCTPCHLNCTNGCTGPGLSDCLDLGRVDALNSPRIAGIVSAVLSGLIICLVVVVIGLLYRRGLTIRRKRALRRYLESGESMETLEPGEKGTKVHARILKASELRKGKVLGFGVFGTVHKGCWIPEGDTVKVPVAIKTISDWSGRQTFTEITDHMLAMGSLDHPYIVRLLGVCPGPSLQLVTRLSTQGSLLEHLRRHGNSLDPQRLLNWCVQIAKGMFYLEEHCMVHRNLAARNVLLKSDYMVQVSDFGVADLLYPDDKKYVYSEVKTPIKWMALESILFRRYTHQSDVWSYGVTVWEMMSYGADPYTSLLPHDVPGLLEKGERLAQPQICTIDVYMVMVKCWMIDENVRPTFKELASEFTRMARDPPRYLVVTPTRNNSGSDETHQREVKRAQIEADLEDGDDEVLDDGFATPPLHLSPSRSHSRLRANSHRSGSGQSAPVGYLPMTPSPGDNPRHLWSPRSRQGSIRTTSECSEGRSTVADIEMTELCPPVGSLRRGRSRIDSAYMSTSTSVASDALPPTGVECPEEDPNGYVLPRATHTLERDPLLSRLGSQTSGPYSRASRSSRGTLSPSTPHSPPAQEYELMSKQPGPAPRSPKPAGHRTASTTCSASLPPLESDHDHTPTQQPGHRDTPPTGESQEHRLEEGNEATGEQAEAGASEETALPGERSRPGSVVEYEYMDIRGAEPASAREPSAEQSGTTLDKPHGERESPSEGEEEDEDDETEPDDNNKLAHSQPGISVDLHSAEEEEEDEEYEDMCASVAAPGLAAAQAEYQNLQGNLKGNLQGNLQGKAQGKVRPGGGEEVRSSRMNAYMKVRAGVGEPSNNTSFDNPDYWHSRLLLKPDTVRT